MTRFARGEPRYTFALYERKSPPTLRRKVSPCRTLREEIPFMSKEKNYRLADFASIKGTPCACGISKRAFVTPDNSVASMHLVEISQSSRAHYHKKMTEIYYVLEGEGHFELDGESVPVSPGSAVLIKPKCRHRAIGKLKIINVPIPTFDEEDEWFDD